MKQDFNFLGFRVNTRKFILTCIITLSVLLFLVGVDILWFDVPWYGLLIGTGFVLAVVIASALSSERGVYKDFSYDLVWLVFPLAIIGARLGYVLNALDEFSSVAEVFGFSEQGLAGLSIYGGIVGGLIGVIIFSLIKKIKVLNITDIVAPVLLLGQAIGRWGNFANQEVYGFEITNKALQWFPFGVFIDNGMHEGWFLATFFYESVLNLIGFFVLLKILRTTKEKGIATFSYLIFYGVVRFILESLRMAEFVLRTPILGLRFSSLFSIILILIGVFGIVYLKRIKPNMNLKDSKDEKK